MKKNNSGFTIVEVLTGIALLGIVTYGIVSGTTMLFKTEGKTGSLSEENKLVQSIINNISTDPAVYQKNFISQSTSTAALLATNNLPMAYGKDIKGKEYFGPRAGCNVCDFYIGYVIRPKSGMPGLFEVTLRLQKLPVNPSSPNFKDYIFLTQSN